ncbi:MAG: DHH family phosphoesterase [Phototrophicaceae bacterium]|jgi:phosphoesterase RecJ-like protein
MTNLTTNKLDFEQASRLVQSANRILLVTHLNPDGDALGSLLGLANALWAQGKTLDAAVDDGVYKSLSFLPNSQKVYPKLTVGDWDLMISLDASDEVRTGHVGEYGRKHSKQVINVDHHVTNTLFGDTHLVMVDAVSTTQIVFEWLQFMKLPIEEPLVALPLLTGLVTDTLGFRTSNVTARTLEIAHHLMKAGASLTEIMTRTLENKSYAVIQLWAEVLPSVKLQQGVISIDILYKQFHNNPAEESTTGSLVGLLNQVEEARIAAIFQETQDGKVKLSLRSKHGYNVGEVAFTLGGGGHTQAAGVTLAEPMAAARERVMPMLFKAVADGEWIIT